MSWACPDLPCPSPDPWPQYFGNFFLGHQLEPALEPEPSRMHLTLLEAMEKPVSSRGRLVLTRIRCMKRGRPRKEDW